MKKPQAKLKTFIFAYCVFIGLTNCYIVYADPELGVYDMRPWGIFIGLLVLSVLLECVWRTVRGILDVGARIPKSASLWGDWRYLLLLFPLALEQNIPFPSALASVIGVSGLKYGGNANTVWLAVLTAAAVMFFQLLVHLEEFNPNNR